MNQQFIQPWLSHERCSQIYIANSRQECHPFPDQIPPSEFAQDVTRRMQLYFSTLFSSIRSNGSTRLVDQHSSSATTALAPSYLLKCNPEYTMYSPPARVPVTETMPHKKAPNSRINASPETDWHRIKKTRCSRCSYSAKVVLITMMVQSLLGAADQGRPVHYW